MRLSPLMLMLLTLAAGMTALAMLDGEQPRPLVQATKADYRRCILVQPPLLKPVVDPYLRRTDIA